MNKNYLILLSFILLVFVLACDSTTPVSVNLIVSNTAEWNAALLLIKNGGDGKTYTINVSGDVAVPGSTENTFGNVKDLYVTLKGDGKLYLTSRGNLIRVSGKQTLCIDSADLILEGLEEEKNGSELNNYIATIWVDRSGFDPAKLELRRGTIRGNHNTDTANFYVGGGVYVGGIFTMSGGSIVENYCRSAGGVMVGHFGEFTISGGYISNNRGIYGGGIYAYNTFTMTGGTINGNGNGDGYGIEGVDGGGITIQDTTNRVQFLISGGTIRDNVANNGSGVYIHSGILKMTGGLIHGNSGKTSGGGVSVNSTGTFEMSGGTISGNSTLSGGGVSISPGGKFSKKKGTIYGNVVDANNRNFASNTNVWAGHTVYYSRTSNDCYRNTTLTENDSISTEDELPASGEEKNGWIGR